MAALSQFPSFSCLSFHKHFSFPLSSVYTVRSHQRYHHAISACSIKKTRASRKVKSNAELCNDIREFLSAVGLPEGHVPSTKELSQYGRQDLANIVRRRGYKLIKQLLSTHIESNEDGLDREEAFIEILDADGKSKDEPPGTQDQKVEDMAEDVLSSTAVPVEQNHFYSANGENFQSTFFFDGKSNLPVESSTTASLQDRVANFIKSGELDSAEDDGIAISHVIGADGGKGFVKSQNATKEGFEWAAGSSNTDKILNGSKSQSEQGVLHAAENNSPSDVYFPSGGLPTADCDDEVDFETRKRENQTEVDRLMSMLHEKELELSQLKEHIEKEKLFLSALQTKAENEIGKAQKLILEKDAELLAAEESLSELKEVQVQYSGDGETVELAGSFNGWHHPITMDPQPSSSNSDPIKSSSGLWSTVLWLYPGMYEIKFIVDGDWRIDPERESVTRGTIQNNILRVDR